MKHPGPLFTLLAGVVLAAGIGVANAANGTTSGTAAPAYPAGTTAAPPPSTSQSATSSSVPPPGNPAPQRADYAGRVDGGGASVAVSVRDGHAIAYVCDGKKTEAWLQGATTGGKLDLKDTKGATLTGSYDATTVTGTVVAGGK